MADVPLQVISENAASERRITPSWTIGQLKARLEPITGVPPLSQKLTLKLKGRETVAIEANDEENTRLTSFPLAPYAELHVSHPLSPSSGIACEIVAVRHVYRQGASVLGGLSVTLNMSASPSVPMPFGSVTDPEGQ